MSNARTDNAKLFINFGDGATLPYLYDNSYDEVSAYKENAWIGTTLSFISPIYDVYGPEAVDFLNSITINNFSNLDDKGLRHEVITNQKGQIMTDGVVIKIAENHYRTYWLNPPIDYLVQESEFDVEGKDLTGTEYIIQISGAKSLEILEDAFQADLHDIKFAKHRTQKVGEKEIGVIRLGMTYNLGYEIHGPIEELDEVYNLVWESGQKFGATQLGFASYNYLNHTEAGFPNINLHYPLPWFESGEGLANYLNERPQLAAYNNARILEGSVGDDLESRFVTPYDVGWGGMINFDKEFTGKEALENLRDNPPRTVVSLEWNPEDVGKAFAAFVTPGGEKVEDISNPYDFNLVKNLVRQSSGIYRADKVFNSEGEYVGNSAGRIRSEVYNSVISIAFVEPKYAEIGTELTVLWGTPGTKQMEIRAKVTQYPYASQDQVANRDTDVEDIPRFNEK